MSNYKNKLKNALKILIIFIITILLCILIQLVSNAAIIRTGEGKKTTVTNAGIVELTGSVSADQVKGANVFLSCYEHINLKSTTFYSLFCNQHGTRLTSRKDKDKDYSTGFPIRFVDWTGKKPEETDSGTPIYVFTGPTGATVLKNSNITESITVSGEKEESTAKSSALSTAKTRANGYLHTKKTITYGCYSNITEKDAKPMEAWVLKEMKKNTYYRGKVQKAWWTVSGKDGTTGGSSGDSSVTVGNYDPTDPSEDNIYFPPSEEESGEGNALAREASAFAAYVEEISGSSDPGTNASGLFNMDYREKVEEMDTSNVNISYNGERNVYIIGPISMQYVRMGVKEGKRKAVDFCGITRATLTYNNESGSQTKLELDHTFYEGTKGFRIVYDHEREMASYDVNDYDSYVEGDNFYYPYPYDREKFYIEVDYSDDVVSIEEFAFDLHWTNAGAKYQDLGEGESYITTWEGDAEYDSTTSHVDGTDTHDPHQPSSTCHEHQHQSYTFKYKIWAKAKTITKTKSQALINCISATTIDYEEGEETEEIDTDIVTTIVGEDDGIWDNSEITIGSSGGSEKDAHVEAAITENAEINYNIGEGKGALRVCAGGWDLTTELAGFVWLEGIKYEKGTAVSVGDSKYSKEANSDGTKDKRMKNIEIRIYKVIYEQSGGEYEETSRTLADTYGIKKYKANGTVLLEDKYDYTGNRIYTNEKGEYKVFVRVPSIKDKTNNQKIVYDVEFIYDGQTYETVEYLVSIGGEDADSKAAAFQNIAEEAKASGSVDYSDYKNDSYIVEDNDFKATTKSGGKEIPAGRQNLDDNFIEIYGNSNSQIQDDKSSTGKAKGDDKKNGDEDKKIDLEYEGKMYSELLAERGDSVEGVDDEDDRIVSQIVTEDDEEKVLDDYKLGSKTSTGSFMLPFSDYIYIRHYSGSVINNDVKIFYQLESKGKFVDGKETWYYPVYEYFHQINMGLIKREDADLSVSKDLYKSEVIVNQQEVTYKYSTLRDYEKEDNGEYLNTLIKMQSVNQKYSLGLYPSDFYYRSDVYEKSDKVDSDIAKMIHDWKKRN